MVNKDFAGKAVVVTAGGTQEPIDPVRHISNRSSGRMGYALAEAARDRGAAVTLITAPAALPEPDGTAIVRIRTADEMREAVLKAVRSKFPGELGEKNALVVEESYHAFVKEVS